MGGKVSAESPNLTEELMDDYLQLTFLSHKEILSIYHRMSKIHGGILQRSIEHRFPWEDILIEFPELRVNPFVDRLARVFSSRMDGRLSFEDMLDMYSALSPQCPPDCKAKWAFKLFDFNDTNALEINDIVGIIDRLTGTCTHESSESKCLTRDEKEKIAKVILEEIDLDHTGSIVTMEFVHAVSKIPDFCSSFALKI